MTLLFTLLTLAVLGMVAAVAAGRISAGLDDPVTSLPSRGLPAGELGPGALADVRFPQVLRGYRMEDVDVVLDRLSVELRKRDLEIERLSLLVEEITWKESAAIEARAADPGAVEARVIEPSDSEERG